VQNYVEKRRDMARSVLPSTRRKGAREDIAAWKRKHRRAIRQQIHDAMGYAEFEDYEGSYLTVDTNRPVDGGSGWGRVICHLVGERQNGDKVAPLIRWTEVTKARLPKDWDDERRFMWFKACLPDNLIGRHALSHIEHLFDLPNDRWWRRRYWNPETREERKARYEAEKEAFAGLVRSVIEVRHAEFNEEFFGDPCYGLHDVDRWARAHWHSEEHRNRVLRVATS